MPLDVPNLDDCSPDELQAFHGVVYNLTRYCEYRSKARKLRLAGRILEAGTLEEAMERVYAQLPEEVRW